MSGARRPQCWAPRRGWRPPSRTQGRCSSILLSCARGSMVKVCVCAAPHIRGVNLNTAGGACMCKRGVGRWVAPVICLACWVELFGERVAVHDTKAAVGRRRCGGSRHMHTRTNSTTPGTKIYCNAPVIREHWPFAATPSSLATTVRPRCTGRRLPTGASGCLLHRFTVAGTDSASAKAEARM